MEIMTCSFAFFKCTFQNSKEILYLVGKLKREEEQRMLHLLFRSEI